MGVVVTVREQADATTLAIDEQAYDPEMETFNRAVCAMHVEHAIRAAGEPLAAAARDFVEMALGLCARESWYLDDGETEAYEVLKVELAKFGVEMPRNKRDGE